MRTLLAVRGFIAFTVVIFVNAFVDLGHKIVVQNAIFHHFEGDTQIALYQAGAGDEDEHGDA